MGMPVLPAPYPPGGRFLDIPARNRLVEEHLPIAGYVTSEFASAHSGLDRDELSSIAMEALVLAADAFRPEEGMAFGAFARRYVRYRVIDALRDVDTVGRRIRVQVQESLKVEAELQSGLGRTATQAEIADAMGMSSASLQAKREQAAGDVPLPEGAEDALADAGWGPEGTALAIERTRFIARAVAKLPELQRRIVEAVYFPNESVASLARELGVSRAAVSQRRAEALELLRGAYKDGFDAEAPIPVPARQRVSPERTRRYHQAKGHQPVRELARVA